MSFPTLVKLLLLVMLASVTYNTVAHFQLQVHLKQQRTTPHTYSIEVLDRDIVSRLERSMVTKAEQKQAQIETQVSDNRNKRLLREDSLRRVKERHAQQYGSASDFPSQQAISSQIRVNIQNNGLQTPITQLHNNKNIITTNQKYRTSTITPQTTRQLQLKTFTINPQPVLPFSINNNQRMNAIKWREIVQQNYEEIITDKMMEEYDYYEHKYQISSYEQLPFCIVVPTYNNNVDQRYLRNIRSIVMQNYSNYHIVLMDDASTDGTGDLIVQYLNQQTLISRYAYDYVRNDEQKRAMYNLRRAAVQFCQPHEIFVIVDGDDELIGRQVLKLFNSVFQKTGAWFVYSNFIMHEGKSIGYSRPFPKKAVDGNSYRNYPFVTSHLRAFYTKLFTNIKEEDLKDENGHYFRAANDVAICMPILQQSHRRVHYVPELTYYYNSNTGQNNHRVRAFQQRSNDRKIRRKQQYNALQDLFGSN